MHAVDRMKKCHYAKYIRLAKSTDGCLKFCAKYDRGSEDVEVLRYFVETSNWFLFGKKEAVLKIISLEKGWVVMKQMQISNIYKGSCILSKFCLQQVSIFFTVKLYTPKAKKPVFIFFMTSKSAIVLENSNCRSVCEYYRFSKVNNPIKVNRYKFYY